MDSGEGLKSGEDTESSLNQEVELNYQVEVQDHIHSQVQFQERDNLPKCRCGFQILEFGQVQMRVLKWNLVFQKNMILWLQQNG